MTKRYIITATIEGYRPKYYEGHQYGNEKDQAIKFDDLLDCCKKIIELKERWTWPDRPVWDYVEVK